ncbi:N-6 DNA methylase [Candidatus Poribacteria bacterium]|nr:N-6 DNA methylase [Candidatus Poribacteria bacterium]MYH82030.1 N-6 DNA methylase [Candidatus Poribacteria bacterium]MYK95211.1 N-6 DNA methylase [Candidatus Poribacteria bacterium]
MSYQTIINKYRQNIYSIQAEPNATAELSLHTYIQDFLEETADFLGHDVTIIHEPRKLDIGRPDFVVQDGLLHVGYVEAEAFETDLDRLTGHAKTQTERFIENLDNFVLTNFVEFQLYTEGTLRAKASLTGTQENDEKLETLLDRFLGSHPISLATPEALANYLARRTRELRIQITTTLTDEQSDIYGMFKAFQELLLAALTPDDFADMYAQTLAYGLFAARCTLPNATNFSRFTAYTALPRSNPFLRRLFYYIASPELDNNLTWILDDIADLLRNVPTEMLRTAFDAQTHIADPIIHFYETFLAEYDATRRVDRGVYYTPPQAISYIVRSVDSLLKTDLRKVDGIADGNALILDPATGTGGFLLAVLEHIQQYVTKAYGTGYWQRYVNGELVRRLAGFEILVAPYTIAHLKLSMFLQRQGWNPENTERLGIYLTNTLEEPREKERYIFASFISDEANAAVSVKKDAPILAILGNPPYPRSTANPSRDSDGNLNFIGRLIEDYKSLDGKRMAEPNYQVLQADYVKFIRWAQWRIDKNGEGVIGYIVNNSFLDGVIFRGMRRSLMNSFNAIYCLNLHGSSRIKEDIPDAEIDENIFDIQQGVSILLCVKERDNPNAAKIYYADLWGSREEKYTTLLNTDVQSTDWTELHATSSLYLFVPHDAAYIAEYEKGWDLTDIFQSSSIGVLTARDKLTVHRTPEAVHATVTDFAALPEAEARQKYKLPKDSTDWKVIDAQADLRNHPEREKHIVPIYYRPLDTRYTYYTGRSGGFHCRPRPAISSQLVFGENLALCTCRGIKAPVWQHVLVTDRITAHGTISNKEGPTHVFPLYIYAHPERQDLSTERSTNLKPAFLKAFSEKLGLPQTGQFDMPEGISPENVLAYIYAVLHSPTYRDRYYEFLKYGFPRIPLPKDISHFRRLSTLGQRLMNMHLLKNVPGPPRHRFEGEGDGVVSKLAYRDGHVWINPTQHFANVPEAVWEFEIGAYQVCEKWLQDRKGEVLSDVELQQYQQILVAVAETIDIVMELDVENNA